MDAVIDGQPQHQGREDQGEEVEVPHHQGDQPKGPTETQDQDQPLHQGAPQAPEKQDQQSQLAQQRQPGGQGDVFHGTAHFVGFQGVGAGYPRLQAGIIRL